MKAIIKFLSKRRTKKKKNKKKKENVDVGRNPLSVTVDRKKNSKTKTSTSKSSDILRSKVKPPQSTNKFKYRKIVSNMRGTDKTASVLPEMRQEDEVLTELKYVTNFLEAFRNTATHYEQLLDQLADRDTGDAKYRDIVEQIHDFQVNLEQSASQLNSLLLMKRSTAHKTIKQVELLRSVFIKSCKSCKETTMTFQAIVKHKNFEVTKFDSFVQSEGDTAKVASRESAVKEVTSTSTISTMKQGSRSSNTDGLIDNAAHAELETAVIDFLEDAKKLGIDGKGSIGCSSVGDASVTSVRSRIISHPENSDQLLEPVYSQFRKAKDLIALQLEKSRSDLYKPFQSRDSIETFTDICTAKELRRDGQYLMAAYNLGPLGDGLGIYGRGDTFKAISQTSLVYDPFLDFDPRSDTMKMYVKSLHATSNGGKGFIGGKCNDEVESGRVGITSYRNLKSP